MKIISNSITACLLATVMLMSGCTKTIYIRDPFYVSDQYKPKKEQEIVLLQTINLGADPDLETDLDITSSIKLYTTRRGYKFTDKTKTILPIEVTSSMLSDLDFKWVKQLKLKPDSWVMVVVVESLKRFGLIANALLSGYLVEYPTGNVVWEGGGYGKMNAGLFLISIADDDALLKAVYDLAKGLPVNNSTTIKGNIIKDDQKNKFSTFVGGCANRSCDKSDTKAHICVVMEKSASPFDEEDEYVNTYPLHDGLKLIGELEAGQYICWIKDPGKTIIFLGTNNTPAYFRTKPGKYYYLNFKWGYSKGWNGFFPTEIPSSKGDSILATHKLKKPDN